MFCCGIKKKENARFSKQIRHLKKFQNLYGNVLNKVEYFILKYYALCTSYSNPVDSFFLQASELGSTGLWSLFRG